MNLELRRTIRNKEEKSEVEYEYLKYCSILALISEVLVQESKLHISSEDAIRKIRECLNDNL